MPSIYDLLDDSAMQGVNTSAGDGVGQPNLHWQPSKRNRVQIICFHNHASHSASGQQR